MKTVLVLILLLLALTTQAQTFHYNNYCTGMTADTCKNVFRHSTCSPQQGTILFATFNVKIDSTQFYLMSTDTTFDGRILYYTQQRLKDGMVDAACIVYDRKNSIVTLITCDPGHRDVMFLDFFMFRPK